MNHSLPTIPSTLTNEIAILERQKNAGHATLFNAILIFAIGKKTILDKLLSRFFFFDIIIQISVPRTCIIIINLVIAKLDRDIFFYLFLQPYYQASIKLLIPSPPIVCTLSQHRLTCRDRSLASLLSRRSNNSRRQTDFTKSSTSSTTECTTRLHLFQNICFPPYQSNYQFLVILVF